VISEKDKNHPFLSEVHPFSTPRKVILGAKGQVANSLSKVFKDASPIDRTSFDLGDIEAALPKFQLQPDWVLNAAAFTKVDLAETEEGAREAWNTNASGVSRLATACLSSSIGLVHYSTDYVFDGNKRGEYDEKDEFMPINAYGHSKAAGDLAVSVLARHYILRTSWVVGNGNNFVRTMAAKAADGSPVSVVSDQIGRLTFADDLAQATEKLISSGAPFGTYNVTNSGPSSSWYDIARTVYESLGRDPKLVTPITSAEFDLKYPGRAKRPRNSMLSLQKLETLSGHLMPDWRESLAFFLKENF
jgi:dTDP-4-dehydrorhamnose 3,5-epimerase